MEKDKKRFNRSKKQSILLKTDVQAILVDISTSKIKSMKYLEGGFSNTNYLVEFEGQEESVVVRATEERVFAETR